MTKLNQAHDLLNQLRDQETAERDAKDSIKFIKDQLSKLIPSDKTRYGITHKLRTRKTKSYAVAWAAIVEKVVPKTRRALCDRILEDNTKVSTWSTFTEEENK